MNYRWAKRMPQVVLALVVAVHVGVVGCTPIFDENAEQVPGSNAFVINLDSADPLVMEAVFGGTGETVRFFGTKDAEGFYSRIDELQCWTADANSKSAPIRVSVDDLGWPVSLRDSKGTVIDIEYDAGGMVLTHVSTNGWTETERYMLPLGVRESEKRMVSDAHLPTGWSWDTIPNDGRATVVVELLVTQSHYGFGLNPTDESLSEADITVKGTNISSVGIREFQGKYMIEVEHDVKDLSAAVEALGRFVGKDGASLSEISRSAAVVADSLSNIKGPSGQLLGTVFTNDSPITELIVESDHSYAHSFLSADAEGEGVGNQSVSIQVSADSTDHAYVMEYSYNVLNRADAVMLSDPRDGYGRIVASIVIDGCGYLRDELAANAVRAAADPNNRELQCTLAKNKQLLLEQDCDSDLLLDDVENEYRTWCENTDQQLPNDCDMSGYIAVDLLPADIETNSFGWSCTQNAEITNLHETETRECAFISRASQRIG